MTCGSYSAPRRWPPRAAPAASARPPRADLQQEVGDQKIFLDKDLLIF
jgi:hypothetical protein